MPSKRTRHDFFYFQIVTRYYLNYLKLQGEFSSKEYLEKLKNMRNEISEYAGNKLTKVELDEFSETIGVKDMTLIIFQLRAFGTIAVVFSGLCLEALINDYCIFKRSSNYLSKHVDKLSPVSKWKVFPELFTGKSFSSNGKTLELLKELYSFRNSLVHPKSKILESDTGDKQNTLIQDLVTFTHNVEQSYITIKEATNELYHIDNSFTYLKDYECLWNGDFSKFKNISDIKSFYLTLVNDVRF